MEQLVQGQQIPLSSVNLAQKLHHSKNDQKDEVSSEIQKTLNQILDLLQQRENEKRVQEEQNSINQVLWGLIENNAVQTINMPELDEQKKHKMLDILLEIKSIQD